MNNGPAFAAALLTGMALAGGARCADLQKLSESLRSGEPKARQNAAFVLGTLGPEAADARPALQAALQDADPKVRRLAGWALEQVEEAGEVAATPLQPSKIEDLPSLIRALDHSDEYERVSAAQAIGKRGPAAAAAVPALREALKDGNWLVRQRAAESLGLIGPAAVNAVASLVWRLSDDPAEGVRRETATALRHIVPDAVDLIDAAAQGDETAARKLRDWGQPLPGRSIRSIPKLGESDDLRALVALLQDPDAAVRRQAAQSLLESSMVSAESLPVLRSAMVDTNLQVRIAAASAYDWVWAAMEQEGSAGSVLVYSELLQDDDQHRRLLAAEALWLKSQRDDVAASVPQLIQVLKDDSTPMRLLALAILGRVGPKAMEAAPQVAALLKNENRLVRTSAQRALDLMKPHRVKDIVSP